jgi:hypothetical protein
VDDQILLQARWLDDGPLEGEDDAGIASDVGELALVGIEVCGNEIVAVRASVSISALALSGRATRPV